MPRPCLVGFAQRHEPRVHGEAGEHRQGREEQICMALSRNPPLVWKGARCQHFRSFFLAHQKPSNLVSRGLEIHDSRLPKRVVTGTARRDEWDCHMPTIRPPQHHPNVGIYGRSHGAYRRSHRHPRSDVGSVRGTGVGTLSRWNLTKSDGCQRLRGILLPGGVASSTFQLFTGVHQSNHKTSTGRENFGD